MIALFFNSHPHKEDDGEVPVIEYLNNFSTHILTRRMTDIAIVPAKNIIFSTHILTRRMTA